ncbi:MAG TPA: UvrD-helicase domain-containing protein [Candidatus Acidoferrales bacterium]|nr:UvrD-helicase domain-containing protein [Candidatus Acidoferrales bacterium]
MSLLDDLNAQQREAVLATEGPVLVLAGAGTGKTRVITYRVARLLSQGVPPSAILAVTFTNKAAGEMKERLRALVPSAGEMPWVGTFHSFCAWLLRRDGHRIGIARDFTIYDDEDQASVVRQALRRLQADEKRWPPRSIRDLISWAKNQGLGPEEFRAQAFDERGRLAAEVWKFYHAALEQARALDFDDLLLEAVRLLRTDEEARRRWSGRFGYVLVDEYQDINRVQYELVRLLAGERQNLCVVGDEDQSIYSWRGADPGILLRFRDDFPDARLLRLEANYRSTQTILDAAGALVQNNSGRLGKRLEAVRAAGPLVRFHEAQDSLEEAAFVVGEAERLLREHPEGCVAVLYRANFQSRLFEEMCRRARLPFRLIGGFGFFQRAEVKDLLSYARLLIHPDDDAALERIINTPPRGLGKAAIDALRTGAAGRGVSLWAALAAPVGTGPARAAAAYESFRALIEGLRAKLGEMPPGTLLREIARRTGYLDWLEEQDRAGNTDRAGNVKELVAAAEEAQETGEALAEFLDRAALVSDADNYDRNAPLTLMTLHSAKGLEFDHVFLVGMEEGLFPHARCYDSQADLQEERRLCYVGMTRARLTLTLTRARLRRSFDRRGQMATRPSRFLDEIPGELVETIWGVRARATQSLPLEPSGTEFEPADASSRQPGALPGTPRSLRGKKVRHPTFGVGTIVEVEEDGDDRRFTVSFPQYGTRKLIERYAKLQRV